MSIKLLSSSKCFEGEQRVYEHNSTATNCQMKFGIFMPPSALVNQKCPVLYFLSGLGCTHENFIHKSGMQRFATKYGFIVVNSDTSPRNVDISNELSTDFLGPGAGFYINATEEPWSRHYQMYTYVAEELPQLIADNFPIMNDKIGIFGDSMGGHGALVCALRNPKKFKSISVFEPVSNPIASNIGSNVFASYLGKDKINWLQYDATSLTESYNGQPLEILLDQGTSDSFYLNGELLPENLIKAAEKNGKVKIIYKLREGYSHGSMFVKTFIEEHFSYHNNILNCPANKL